MDAKYAHRVEEANRQVGQELYAAVVAAVGNWQATTGLPLSVIDVKIDLHIGERDCGNPAPSFGVRTIISR